MKPDEQKQVKNLSKQKEKKKKDIKLWDKMVPGETANILKMSVHYSSRPINTNAEVVGVRLSSDDVPDLPYVAFSTMNMDRRITTYVVSAAYSGKFAQILSVICDTTDEKYKNCTDEQKQQILQEVAVLNNRYELGLEFVDAHLRQTLFPLGNNEYIALTPLASPPMSFELSRRIQAEKDAAPEGTPKRLRAVTKIGGGKPQNAGANIHSMHEPIIFDAPKESRPLRKALAIHHKGVTIASLLPKMEIIELMQWRDSIRQPNGGFLSTLQTRTKEVEFFQAITRKVMLYAKSIGIKQDEFIDLMGSRISTAVDPLIQSLIDPSLRQQGWSRTFACALMKEIENFRPDKQSVSVAQNGDFEGLISIIEDVLR